MYKKVQNIAKKTIYYLSRKIKPGMTEKEISLLSDNYMKKKGIKSFWYHGVGSLVLVGNRTLLSISGKEYKPTKKKVNTTSLVTVDLSPELDSYWGDFARSFPIENGKVKLKPKCKIFAEGIHAEEELHQFFCKIIKPEMEFGQAFDILNNKIKEMQFINLDFHGNLGHTIEKDIDDRIYIEKGCKTKFKDVKYFTFEPHIKKNKSKCGFKKEDIYYFSKEKLKKL